MTTDNAQSSAQETSAAIPEDFQAYEKWRETGELPAAKETDETTDALETDAETEPASEPEDEQAEEQDKPKAKGGFQRKIDKLTGEKYRLEAEKAELERRLAEQSAAKPAEKRSAPEGKPKAEDFDTYEDYVERLTDWKLDQKESERRVADKQKTQAAAWTERQDAVRAKHPDYEDVLETADVPIPPAVQQAIFESDNGPLLAYELAKNPKELERILALSPVAAIRELGKFEAKITPSPETKKTTRVSSAPAPVKRVGSAAPVNPSIYDKDLDFSTYEKLRRDQLRTR
jgi:hypothetical protein